MIFYKKDCLSHLFSCILIFIPVPHKADDRPCLANMLPATQKWNLKTVLTASQVQRLQHSGETQKENLVQLLLHRRQTEHMQQSTTLLLRQVWTQRRQWQKELQQQLKRTPLHQWRTQRSTSLFHRCHCPLLICIAGNGGFKMSRSELKKIK